MNTPHDMNALLKSLLTDKDPSMLAPEDEAYLTALIAAIRSGKRAVIVVEDSGEKLKYMFSNASRAEATSMLGKVIEATGRRMAQGE